MTPLSSRPGASPPRGFSLIELLVALTIAVVVMAVATSTLYNVAKNAQRDDGLAALRRQATFIHSLLQHDLRHAGIGVPARDRVLDPTALFDGGIIVALPNAVGILGDFARPHAQYNTFGVLWNQPGGDRNHFAWTTENNGNCMPGVCTTDNYSLWFPSDPAGCNANNRHTDRVCPWGLKRLENGDDYLLASGDGQWSVGTFTFAGTTMRLVGGTWFPELSTPYDDNASPNEVWPNAASTDGPAGVPGIGFVTTLDRVFIEHTGTLLRRRQCWGGEPDLASANWPRGTTNAVPANPAAITVPATCTAWEVISDEVASASFTYFDDTSVATPIAAFPDGAAKASVALVRYDLVLERTVRGEVLRVPVRGAVPIRNFL